MPWQRLNYQRFFPSLTWQSDPQIEGLLAGLPAEARVVDLGAGGRKISPRAIALDHISVPNTHVRADAQRLPFRDGALDAVVATGLLEHVADERAVLSEIARVLRPGGLVHLEVPFLQQYHDDPIDLRRMSLTGLRAFVEREGFVVLKCGFHIGPTVTVTTLLTYYAALWFEGRSFVAKALSTLVFLFCSTFLYPLKFLDALLLGKASAHRLAFAVYCTGQKRVGGAGSPRGDGSALT